MEEPHIAMRLLTWSEAEKIVGATSGRFRTYMNHMHIVPRCYTLPRFKPFYAPSDIEKVRAWHKEHGEAQNESLR